MEQLYKGGEISPFLHPIDAKDWMNLGWDKQPGNTESSTETEGGAEVPESLTLINDAANASQITVLPGIGTVSAGLIFAARPPEGFVSLEVVAAVDGLPSSIDWVVVESWSAS